MLNAMWRMLACRNIAVTSRYQSPSPTWIPVSHMFWKRAPPGLEIPLPCATVIT